MRNMTLRVRALGTLEVSRAPTRGARPLPLRTISGSRLRIAAVVLRTSPHTLGAIPEAILFPRREIFDVGLDPLTRRE
jgi:hypothetical protein